MQCIVKKSNPLPIGESKRALSQWANYFFQDYFCLKLCDPNFRFLSLQSSIFFPMGITAWKGNIVSGEIFWSIHLYLGHSPGV